MNEKMHSSIEMEFICETKICICKNKVICCPMNQQRCYKAISKIVAHPRMISQWMLVQIFLHSMIRQMQYEQIQTKHQQIQSVKLFF